MITKIRNNWNALKNEKASPLLVFIMILNTVIMLVSNITAAKTFTLFNIGDLAIVLPSAMVIFPIAYVLSDVLSEVYGYTWSRRSAWVSFAMNLFMVAVFEICIIIPGETDLGVLKSTWFLLIASLLSYITGGLVNDVVFKIMKKRAGKDAIAESKGVLGRAIISSIFGQFCDSMIYIPLGMNIFPKMFLGFEFMSWVQVAICVLLQPTIKVIYEIIVSPLTVKSCKALRKYESEAGNAYGL